MKTISLGYGQGEQTLTIKEKNLLAVLEPNEIDIKTSADAELKRALARPVAAKRLKDIVLPGEKIALITSDITRPMPTAQVLPALLAELYAAGARREDITLVFGLGIHRRQSAAEQEKLVGSRVLRELRCLDSDPQDFINFGSTKRGTPVDIFRPVAEAERRICLGNIEYHYFAGYSGGAKALMPGVSSQAAIQNNHSLMLQDKARAGLLAGNPVREDIEEAAALVGIDFILNVVLDEKKRILRAFAGQPQKAHQAGCKLLDQLYKVPLPALADIVIVSQGGSPKDLNLYQLQKALDNAQHAVKEGGIIILVGACPEGLGNERFASWLHEAKAPRDLITRIRTNFALGGHKAAAIALVLEKAAIYLVSELADDLVRDIFMQPFGSCQAALEAALAKKGPAASVLVIPSGGSILPAAPG